MSLLEDDLAHATKIAAFMDAGMGYAAVEAVRAVRAECADLIAGPYCRLLERVEQLEEETAALRVAAK